MPVHPPGARASSRLPARFRQPSIARNVVSNWIVTFGTIAYSFTVLPIVVRALTQEGYGIWSFLNAVLGYSDLLYLGLGASLVRYVAEARAREDPAALDRLASVTLTVYVFLGLVALAGSAALGLFAPRLFASVHTDIPPSDIATTCVLLGVRLLTVFVGSLFSGVLIGEERQDVANLAPAVFVAARAIAVPLAVHGDSPLLKLAATITLLAAAEMLATAALALVAVPGLRVRLRLPAAGDLRRLYGFGIPSFILMLSIRLIGLTGTTIVGLMLSAEAVALYSFPVQLIEYGGVAIAGIVGTLLPRLTVLHTREDRPALRDAYLRLTRASAFLAVFMMVTVAFLGPPFLDRWLGPAFGSPVRWVLVLLGASSVVHVLSIQAAVPFYQAFRLLRMPAAILLVEAFVNLALSIALAPRFGLNGIAFGTLFPAVVVGAAVLPRYLHRVLGVSFRSVMVGVLWPSVLLAATIAFVHAALERVLPNTAYAVLLIRIAATVPFALAVLWTTFPPEDRAFVLAAVAPLADRRTR